jgi:hypothetical protein
VGENVGEELRGEGWRQGEWFWRHRGYFVDGEVCRLNWRGSFALWGMREVPQISAEC